jgi:hydroxyethylthiazole kinase-like uncharacterized protein yjeF
VRPVHDVDTVRAAERAVMEQLPDGALMQRAATGLARRCADVLEQVYGSHVLLLVGKGNNGGDALYAGARLCQRGAQVTALLIADAEPPAALDALLRAGGRAQQVSADDRNAFEHADLVVDGLLGIGGKGALRAQAAQLAEYANDSGATVVAVDVPSGVDADSGRVEGSAVRADITVTFGTLKPGLLVAPGAHYAGIVECVDIGLTPHLPPPTIEVLDADDVAALLPDPEPETDKYHRGVVGVAAGSDTYTGAAVLTTGGAIVNGAGMVRFVSVAHPAELVRARWPEAVVTVVPPGDGTAVIDAGQVQAWVVGPGLGTDDAAAAVVEAILGTDLPVLVDADAISILASHREWLTQRRAPTLLTPHAGEFARLVGADRGDVEADRLTHVRKAAADLGVTVLLKGSTTVVADPDGHTRINPTGTRWLGTAGTGDVLSGVCGALLATGCSALDAGSAGAFLHGLAARLVSAEVVPIAATDLLDAWPGVLRVVRAEGLGPETLNA